MGVKYRGRWIESFETLGQNVEVERGRYLSPGVRKKVM